MSRADVRADEEPSVESLFLGTEAGADAYRAAMARAVEVVLDSVAGSETPYSGERPESLREYADGLATIPDRGDGVESALADAGPILRHSVGVAHPKCIAHLQCPPTTPALAAEAMLTAANQSMDSWDQSPAATLLETRLVEELCELFGYETGDDPATGDGVFTSGGTQSNFLGLLLARERFASERFGIDVQQSGLPHRAKAMRVLCSEEAHFTAEQAAAHLGLGENAVVPVETTDDRELCPDALDRTLAELDARDLLPFALVGTAGTTDFGAIDPLDELADRADERDLWFHVDAAYGGALAVSDEHRHRLSGIERADSIAVDFHKLFYQPISCGAFLLRDGSQFDHVARNASYLNPADDAAPNLVAKSPQTTRRFDALKPFVTFRALGRNGLAALVEGTLDLAADAAALVAETPAFELLGEPTLNTVVFRYRPTGGVEASDGGDGRDGHDGSDGGSESGASDARVSWVNEAIRESLLREGEAVVARTEADGVAALKFTLLNPRTTLSDVASVLAVIERRGDSLATVSREVQR